MEVRSAVSLNSQVAPPPTGDEPVDDGDGDDPEQPQERGQAIELLRIVDVVSQGKGIVRPSSHRILRSPPPLRNLTRE